MVIKKIIPGLFLMAVSINCWGVIPTISARQIMLKNRQLRKPYSSRGTVKLVIKNSGLKSTKKFRIYTKKFGAQTRSRINFRYPNRMQFLIHSLPGGSTRQWIKLSSGRVRRVASGSRAGSWAGSHFYYEDLRTYSMNDYRFYRLKDAIIKDYKKKPVYCYRVRAINRRRGGVYSKRIIYVDSKTWQIRRVKFYQRGRHTKTLTNYLFKKINGISTPRLVYMQPAGRGGSHSYLLMQSMRFNLPLSARLFRRSTF